MVRHERVVVIGAGPCGLGIARQLEHHHGVDALVVDRADVPASAWRRRYDGFRLNTCGFWSHLPGQRIPLRSGRWPTRDDMVRYFDDYIRRQKLRLEFGVSVKRLDRAREGWRIESDGRALTADAVVIATGNHRCPAMPSWPGRETFAGTLLHSADYRAARSFAKCDVLVVGSGNSAVDIAVQLCEKGARRVRMAVRSTPHLVPRSMAGLPVDTFSPFFAMMPPALLDHAAKLMQHVWFGDLRSAGLPLPEKGIYTALMEDEHIPTIGDEVARCVRDGRVEVVPGVESFDGSRVNLTDGTSIEPEVVIAATGYRRALEPLVGHLGVLDDAGKPVSNGSRSATVGLWFAGYEEPLIGPLRSFRKRATATASSVARYLAAAS